MDLWEMCKNQESNPQNGKDLFCKKCRKLSKKRVKPIKNE